MPGKFEVYKDKGSQFRFRLKAANGEVIAAGSESYPDKKSALKGIASIQKNAAEAKIVDTTIEAEAKKPAAKKTAEKKPAAKKTATKKPAAKKTAAKKPAAKAVKENKPAE
jgi:uncharacterized protein YegP (UPF0339 family)